MRAFTKILSGLTVAVKKSLTGKKNGITNSFQTCYYEFEFSRPFHSRLQLGQELQHDHEGSKIEKSFKRYCEVYFQSTQCRKRSSCFACRAGENNLNF